MDKSEDEQDEGEDPLGADQGPDHATQEQEYLPDSRRLDEAEQPAVIRGR